jgi:hypothetical protein
MTELSVKESRFDCGNGGIGYNNISNVSYLHLRALTHTTPLSLSLSLYIYIYIYIYISRPIEMPVEFPIKLQLQQTYDFIGPLLRNITDIVLRRTFMAKNKTKRFKHQILGCLVKSVLPPPLKEKGSFNNDSH